MIGGSPPPRRGSHKKAKRVNHVTQGKKDQWSFLLVGWVSVFSSFEYHDTIPNLKIMLSFVALPIWEFTHMDWCCLIFRVMMVIRKAKKLTVLVFHFYLLLLIIFLRICNYKYLRIIKSHFLMIKWFYIIADLPVNFKFSSLQISDFRRKIVVPQLLLGTWLVLIPLTAWKLSNFTFRWMKCKPLSRMLYLHYPCSLPFPVLLLVTCTDVRSAPCGLLGVGVELGQAWRLLKGWGRTGILHSSVTMASASWKLSCCTQLIL